MNRFDTKELPAVFNDVLMGAASKIWDIIVDASFAVDTFDSRLDCNHGVGGSVENALVILRNSCHHHANRWRAVADGNWNSGLVVVLTHGILLYCCTMNKLR
jgi:hypothetical protein